MRGKNGALWQTTAVGKQKVWKAVSSFRDYPIYHNGGIPFVLRLSSSSKAYVYKVFAEKFDFEDEKEQLQTPKEPFDIITESLGRSVLVLWRPYAFEYQKSFLPNSNDGEDGHCYLFQIRSRQYIFVGSENVIGFSTEEGIKEFHATMGNNQVSYAFAVSRNFTYFPDNEKKMMNDEILRLRAARGDVFSTNPQTNRLGIGLGGLPDWEPWDELWFSQGESESYNLEVKELFKE